MVKNAQNRTLGRERRAFVIVVGIDLGEASRYALDQAARVAMRVPGSKLHVIHVVKDGGEADAEDLLEKTAANVRVYVAEQAEALGGLARAGVGIHVRMGNPAHEVVQLAREIAADLIVLGTQRPPHIKRLILGSVTERVVRCAGCPVLDAGPKPAGAFDDETPRPGSICQACLAVRSRSGGEWWWCERHTEEHGQTEAYTYRSELPYAEHDADAQPASARM